MTAKSGTPLECVTLRLLCWESGLAEPTLATAAGVALKTLKTYLYDTLAPEHRLKRLLTKMQCTLTDYNEILAALTTAAAARAAASLPSSLTPVDPTPEEWSEIRRLSAQAGREAALAAEECRLGLVRERKARLARDEAEELCAQLGLDPKPRLLVEKSPKLQTWAVAEILAHRSQEEAAERPGRALELADLACRAAELSPHEGPFRQCLLGYTLVFGTVLVTDPAEAEERFAKAEALWDAGAGAHGPLAAWRLLDLAGSFHRKQGRLAESLARLDAALACAPGDAKGKILMNKVFTLEQMGEAEQAVGHLAEAERLVDRGREPQRFFDLRFHQALCLCFLDRFGKAELLLSQVKKLGNELGRALTALWLGGRVAAGLQRWRDAEAAFRKVCSELNRQKAAWDSALVSTELAVLLCRQSRFDEAGELARGLAWVLEADEISDEARDALRELRAAAESSALTLALAERVLARLQRASRDSEAPPSRQTGRRGGGYELSVFAATGSVRVDTAAGLRGRRRLRGAGVAAAARVEDAAAVQAVEGRGPQGGHPRNPPAHEVGGVQGGGGAASRQDGRGGGEEEETNSKETPNDDTSKHDDAPVRGGAGASSPGRADHPA